MTTDREQFHYDDFTTGHYRGLLRLAADNYGFRRFADFVSGEHHILWRHDVDISPQRAVRLAEIEHEEGVIATYFVRLHSEFYNFWDERIVDAFRHIAALGHDIGLHFEASIYGERSAREFEELLATEGSLLATAYGVNVDAFSAHNPSPSDLEWDAPTYAGMTNSYSRRLRHEVGYCSDSSGYWRFRRLHDVLSEASDHSLHVLTHPVWWQETPMSPHDRVRRCIEDRSAADLARYNQIIDIAERENIGRVEIAPGERHHG